MKPVNPTLIKHSKSLIPDGIDRIFLDKDLQLQFLELFFLARDQLLQPTRTTCEGDHPSIIPVMFGQQPDNNFRHVQVKMLADETWRTNTGHNSS